MRICKTIDVLLVTICVLSACQKIQGKPGGHQSGNKTEIKSPFNYIYQQNTGGYQVYRIPAVVASEDGVVLAFAEARKTRSTGDTGDIDLVLRRSEDGGKTWGPMQVIWDDGRNTCGNPVPIVGENGMIHLLMTWNNGEDNWSELTSGTSVDTRRPYYTYSSDSGKTWAKPIEITESVKNKNWEWYGTGPCHGIMMKSPKYAGRLISPNYFTTRESGRSLSYSHVIWSDDGGKTWVSGNPVPEAEVGECTVAELPDGSLILDMRASKGFYRKVSISTDGGMTWSAPVQVTDLVDCICQGSIYSDGIALYHTNAASASERINMTIKKSSDNGRTWKAQTVIHQGKSGYSDITEISSDKLLVLYEGGESRYTEGIDVKIIDKSSIR